MSGRPAARMTDLHVCPLTPPPGLPIIPPCMPTVIVGFMPQARMTDLCACVGPPPANVDAILMGSPTVIVGGLNAARQYDPTVKGGVITTGFPTVLIGDFGFAAPPVLSPVCANLKLEIDALEQAMDMAALSNAAYEEPQTNDNLPENYRRATPGELEALGLQDPATGYDATRIDGSDFRADVFVHTDPSTGQDNYTVAFQGTTPTSGGDWGANFGQGAGQETEYYNQAAEVGRAVNNAAPGNVQFTGHSLGGGLASAASVATGAPGTTFNAAGLHENSIDRYGGGNADVTAWHNEQDPLSRLQDANDWMAPSAYGERRPLPPTAEWTPEERAMMDAHVNPDNWVPDRLERLRGEAEAKAAQQLRFHSMDEMEQILENEMERIRDEQRRNGCI